MSNILQRTATGIAIVTVIISAVMLGAYSFLVLCFLINLFGLIEFYRLFAINQHPFRSVLGVLLSVTLFITICLYILGVMDPRVLLINLPLISLIYMAELYHKSNTPFLNLAFLFLGIAYITIPLVLFFGCAIGFDNKLYHPEIILGYLFLLWASDTGAFITGSLIGKNLLFERISPKKTWEGSAGGVIFVAGIVFINTVFFTEISAGGWTVIGLLVIVMGTLGDLVKSMMKRSLHVKDSGTILPGHGGILDRFDSLIGSAPFVYAALSFLSRSSS
jgi:phosphatidate cytidylyltransferase